MSEPSTDHPRGTTYFDVQNQPGLVPSIDHAGRPARQAIGPPRRFTAEELGLAPVGTDPGSVDRETRERLQRIADADENRRERDAAERAARPTVEQQVAEVMRRVASLEAQRIEDRVRLGALGETLAALKPATVSRIGPPRTPGSAA